MSKLNTLKKCIIGILFIVNLSAGIVSLTEPSAFTLFFFGNTFILLDYLVKERKGWFKSKGIFEKHEKAKIE